MTSLIPMPDAIPAAWGWFQFLLMLMFPLHLLAMNAMAGSTAIAVYAYLRSDQAMKGLAHELAKTIPFLVAIAVNLGVSALLFMQVLYGHLFYASSILMGVYWLAVVPLLIVAYYAAYLFDFRFNTLGRLWALALIITAMAIFLAIGFIYTNNMTLMLYPDAWRAYFDHPGGTILNLSERALFPRYLHFMTGALAVGGLFVALLGRLGKSMDPAIREAAERTGMRAFTILTGVQIVLGFVFLLSLPKPVMMQFMGGDTLATLLLAAGVVLALVLLVAGMARKVWLCAGLAVLLVYIMAFMRDLVRDGYLGLHFSPSSLKVVPQYSPMVMFFAALIIGLASVAWMLKKAAASRDGSGR
jgi:hypothetical protein